jgi:hypothetical protein
MGITEFQVVPNARDTLDHLRNQIIGKNRDPKYDIVDLDLNLAISDAYEGILQDAAILGVEFTFAIHFLHAT